MTVAGAMVWDGLFDRAYPATATTEGMKITPIAKGEVDPAATTGDVIDSTGDTPMPNTVEGHCQPSFTGIEACGPVRCRLHQPL